MNGLGKLGVFSPRTPQDAEDSTDLNHRTYNWVENSSVTNEINNSSRNKDSSALANQTVLSEMNEQNINDQPMTDSSVNNELLKDCSVKNFLPKILMSNIRSFGWTDSHKISEIENVLITNNIEIAVFTDLGL